MWGSEGCVSAPPVSSSPSQPPRGFRQQGLSLRLLRQASGQIPRPSAQRSVGHEDRGELALPTALQTWGFSSAAQVTLQSVRATALACGAGRRFTPICALLRGPGIGGCRWRCTPGAFPRSTVTSSGLVCQTSWVASVGRPSFSSRSTISAPSLRICFSLRSRSVRELRGEGSTRQGILTACKLV